MTMVEKLRQRAWYQSGDEAAFFHEVADEIIRLRSLSRAFANQVERVATELPEEVPRLAELATITRNLLDLETD